MLFANNCNTTLASSLTTGATSMSVTSATGFPSPTGVQYFYCTLADAATQTTIEIVKVTSVTGTTFAITRAQDGTSATAFASDAVVSLRLVRASLNDFPKLDEDNTFSGTNNTFNKVWQLVNSSTTSQYHAFGDGTTTYASLGGYYDSSTTGHLEFYTFSTTLQERMRIDSAGNVGIGLTAPANKLDVASAVSATPVTNGIVRILGTGTNPATGSGGGLLFAQQNSSGTYSNYASITGSRSNNAANDKVDLCFATGSPNDSIAVAERMRLFVSGGLSIGNTTDPGAGNLRFNTTNSNGIYFGSSSILSDYEEGTYTATLTPQTSGTITLNSSVNTMVYRKIGKVVVVTGLLQVSAVSSPVGNYVALNLPYTASSSVYGGQAGGSASRIPNGSSIPTATPWLISRNTANLNLYYTVSTTASPDQINFSITYVTD